MRIKVAALFTLYVWCIFTASANKVDWKRNSKDFQTIERLSKAFEDSAEEFDEPEYNDLQKALQALQEDIKHEYSPGVYKTLKLASGAKNSQIMKSRERFDDFKKDDLAKFTEFQICCEIAKSEKEKFYGINPICRIRARSSEPLNLWYTIVAYRFNSSATETFFEKASQDEVALDSVLKKVGETEEVENTVTLKNLMKPEQMIKDDISLTHNGIKDSALKKVGKAVEVKEYTKIKLATKEDQKEKLVGNEVKNQNSTVKGEQKQNTVKKKKIEENTINNEDTKKELTTNEGEELVKFKKKWSQEETWFYLFIGIFVIMIPLAYLLYRLHTMNIVRDRPEEITNEEAKKGQKQSQNTMNSAKNEDANKNPTDNEDQKKNAVEKEKTEKPSTTKKDQKQKSVENEENQQNTVKKEKTEKKSTNNEDRKKKFVGNEDTNQNWTVNEGQKQNTVEKKTINNEDRKPDAAVEKKYTEKKLTTNEDQKEKSIGNEVANQNPTINEEQKQNTVEKKTINNEDRKPNAAVEKEYAENKLTTNEDQKQKSIRNEVANQNPTINEEQKQNTVEKEITAISVIVEDRKQILLQNEDTEKNPTDNENADQMEKYEVSNDEKLHKIQSSKHFTPILVRDSYYYEQLSKSQDHFRGRSNRNWSSFSSQY